MFGEINSGLEVSVVSSRVLGPVPTKAGLKVAKGHGWIATALDT
ncbi:MAG: hypothetical protein ACI8WB_002785 [Phenylobacterium sp.]|jgi:hypothetical protein